MKSHIVLEAYFCLFLRLNLFYRIEFKNCILTLSSSDSCIFYSSIAKLIASQREVKSTFRISISRLLKFLHLIYIIVVLHCCDSPHVATEDLNVANESCSKIKFLWKMHCVSLKFWKKDNSKAFVITNCGKCGDREYVEDNLKNMNDVIRLMSYVL